MSSILKALKKLEQDRIGRGKAIGLWQRQPEQEDAFAKETRRPRHRLIAFYVLFFPLLVIGGWLLLKYALIPAETSRPGSFILEKREAASLDIPKGIAPASEQTDLKSKSNSPRMPQANGKQGKLIAVKTVIGSRAEVKSGGKKEGKLPAAFKKTPAESKSKPAEKKPQVNFKASQTAKGPISEFGLSLGDGDLILNKDNISYPPSAGADPPPSAEKSAVNESSRLPGFSVQAIAWSRIPAERIAVINGRVVREGEYVEGMHVAQIGIDEVSLKKGDKTWLLQCGQ